jgi:glycosyltransferase involved in cell wall biosynthesis
MRLAYCSPLPPLATGIADYSSELLQELSRRVEVDLFIEDGYQPDASLSREFTIRPLNELTDRSGHDAILYHLGNDARFHGQIYRHALEHPGIVMLHEVALHHMIRILALQAGRAAYIEELCFAYGPRGKRIGERLLELGQTDEIHSYPLFERIVDRSHGVIVHNQTARNRVLASRPKARVLTIPHHLDPGLPAPLDDAGERELKRALRLPCDAFIVSSFGRMGASKRIDVALKAFAHFRKQHAAAIYLLVGDRSGHPELDMLLQGELGQGVLATGPVEMKRFIDYMQVTDLAINLRYPGGSESSGSLMRLMGLARPVVVSDIGSFSELPDGSCVKVPVDGSEQRTLLAYMLALAGNREMRLRIGSSGRDHVMREHALPRVADAYRDAFDYFLETTTRETLVVPRRSSLGHEGIAANLNADIAAALVELGVDGEDEEILTEVARCLTDLGLR